MSQKPRVFPSNEQQKELLDKKAKKEAFESEKKAATEEIYVNSASQQMVTDNYSDAVEMMRQRTQYQMEMKKE